jgi:hypothetical protein
MLPLGDVAELFDHSVRAGRQAGRGRSGEISDVLGGEVDGGGSEVVAKLVDAARAQQHRSDRRSREQPGDSDVSHRPFMAFCDDMNGVEYRPGAFDVAGVLCLYAAVGIVTEVRRPGWAFIPGVLAGKPSAAER